MATHLYIQIYMRGVLDVNGLSITKKLIGAFGLVFAFIAFFGLFILYSFNGLSSERSNVRDWLDSNFTVSKIARDIDDVQRIVKRFRSSSRNLEKIFVN